MDLCVYEVLFQFNQGINQALESLSIVEKLELGSPGGVGKVRNDICELRSYANSHFASKIAQNEQEEENNFYRVHRNREKADEGPNEIYCELKAREESRREQGLPPRAAILPWSQADDQRIHAMRKAACTLLPTQPEQSRTIGDGEQENQRGGTPT
jgi:hypothetical protein